MTTIEKGTSPVKNWADEADDEEIDATAPIASSDSSATPETPAKNPDPPHGSPPVVETPSEPPSSPVAEHPAASAVPSEPTPAPRPKKSSLRISKAPRRPKAQPQAVQSPMPAPSTTAIAECVAGAELGQPRGTSNIRVLDPSPAQIYAALVACNLIVHDHAPPDGFKKGSDVQVALYDAYYDNPRGIKCVPVRDTVHTCFRKTTSCLYSKIIAVIYELADHVMTKERISAINFYDFNSVYGDLISFSGIRWFGVYPLYENAIIHIETFSHKCVPTCPIANIRREIDKINQRDRELLQEYAANHMTMYSHQYYNGVTNTRPWFHDAPGADRNGRREGYPHGAQRTDEGRRDSSYEPGRFQHHARGGYYQHSNMRRGAAPGDIAPRSDAPVDLAGLSSLATANQTGSAFPCFSIGESMRRANTLAQVASSDRDAPAMAPEAAPRRPTRGKRAQRVAYSEPADQ